jgi:hypothetical protein
LRRRWKNARVDASMRILEDIKQWSATFNAFAVNLCWFDLQAESNVGKRENQGANSVRLDLEPFSVAVQNHSAKETAKKSANQSTAGN